MQAKEYRTEDKSTWGPGAWQSEPDKAQWQDEETGLPCLMVRNRGGALCGYVGVPDTHPWHGKDYSACVKGCGKDWCEHTPESAIRVHGGLTFADACADTDDEEHGICHVPDAGEPDNVWWFGFDCSHSGDLSPQYMANFDWYGFRDGAYRDFDYLKSQVASLAHQLAAVR